MADEKITELAAFTSVATGDLLVGVDVSDASMDPTGTDKQLTVAQLLGLLTGDFTVSGFTATIGGGAITNAKLANSSVTLSGRALSLGGSLDLAAADVGLGSVTDDAQTKAAIVPNTAPTAGQVLIGNAGGTAYAPASLSGSGATISLASTGVLTVSAIANASLANSSLTVTAGTGLSGGGAVALGASITLSIAAGGVGTTQLASKAVTAAKIADGTANGLIGFDGSGVATTIAAGSGITISGGTISATTGGGTAPNVQVFTSSGTWTRPSGATFCRVIAIGGGGGGASGARRASGTAALGGAGGGGAAMTDAVFSAADLTATVPVTIGAGGPGGASVVTDSTIGNAGTGGGNTTFGGYLTAAGAVAGGGGGTGGASGNGLWPGSQGGNGGNGAGGTVGLNATGGASGGGGGGGITTGAAFQGGQVGGSVFGIGGTTAGGARGTTDGASGSAGPGSAPMANCAAGGSGGGGGASSVLTVGGTGGAGGGYGSGGGGGGASLNGQASGAGGAGSAGICIIYSW